MKRMTMTRSLACACVTVACMPATYASSVSAGSGGWAARNATSSGSSTWRFSTPTAADTITWTSGANTTDGVGHVQNIFGPEPKFNTVPVLAGRTFAGFTDIDGPGPSGSTTQTSGAGNSLPVPGTIWGTNWRANWTINASGTLGRGAGASWDSQAEALDPLSISASQLAGANVTSSTYDLFFAFGLNSTSLSSLGSASLKVSYEDASGVTKVIDLSKGPGGASVTGSGAAKFFTLASLTEGPTEVAANQKSLSEIGSAFSAGNGPLYLGVVLEDLAVPTVALANGALAQIHIDSSVSDAAAVPEPGAWLMATGGLAMMLGRRHAKRMRGQPAQH